MLLRPMHLPSSTVSRCCSAAHEELEIHLAYTQTKGAQAQQVAANCSHAARCLSSTAHQRRVNASTTKTPGLAPGPPSASRRSGGGGPSLVRDDVMLLGKLHQAVVVVCRRLNREAEGLVLAAAADQHGELLVVWVVEAGLLG